MELIRNYLHSRRFCPDKNLIRFERVLLFRESFPLGVEAKYSILRASSMFSQSQKYGSRQMLSGKAFL